MATRKLAPEVRKVTPAKKDPGPSPLPEKKAPQRAALVTAKPTGGAVAKPMEALKAFAQRGMQQLAKMPTGAQSVSFRGGVITIGGSRVGNEVAIIPLAEQFERAFYDRDYDPSDKSPPDCYSFDNEAPHEKAASPQSEACETCPNNVWGSGPRGRGKACKEGMRLAFVRADGPLDADRIATAPILTAKFSVVNTQTIKPVIEKLYETVGHPAGMVSVLSANPDDAIQIRNDLIPDRPIEPGWQEAVIARLPAAVKQVEQPYPDPDPAEKAKPAKAAPRARKF